jgi:cystathionine gamma-synthase
MLADVLAELEGAAGGAVTNSGQAAALLALLLLPTGAHVVAPHDCYGGTFRLIRGFEDKGRLTADFVDMRDDEAPCPRSRATRPGLDRDPTAIRCCAGRRIAWAKQARGRRARPRR